jgi:hypothetical protein
VTGDSLTDFLGPELLQDAASVGPIRGFTDTHDGTGLVRPDYVDWSIVAQQQVVTRRPDAVVMMLGGSDVQNMVVAGGRVLDTGTPAWMREYRCRAAVVMSTWIHGGIRRVYWLSMPPARNDAWSRHNAEIDLALRQAAAHVPGTEYLDILGPVTDHGRYADFVPVGGQPVLSRKKC